MNEQFDWYFKHLNVDFDDVWNKGILTLDANVLLNLYRYHTDTTNDLLSAIESFGDRVWLSHQAVTEFVNNRKKVIIESQTNYSNGLKHINDFKESSSELSKKLTTQRAFSKDFIEGLQNDICKILDKATKQASSEMSKNGSTGNDDPILKRILKIFGDKVGREPEDIANHRIEAKRRIEGEIPPGYKDKDKSGDRAYGDYLLWQQILDQSKIIKKPIILVTSEQKPDWWEIHSGKTLGPRLELIKEASRYSNQPLIIYQTDRFLEYSLDKAGKKSEAPVAEVRELAEIYSSAPTRISINRVSGIVENIVSDKDDLIGSVSFTVTEPTPVVLVTGKIDLEFKPSKHIICTVKSCPTEEDRILLECSMAIIGHSGFILKMKHIHGARLEPGTYNCRFMLINEDIGSEINVFS